MTGVPYSDDRITVCQGDVLDVLKQLPDNTIDSIVTDPPYGLEFMGKDWDKFGRDTGNGYREKPRMTDDHMGKGFKQLPNHFEAGRPYQAWCELWAAECLRVLKPGGHILAFGGTRTFHRLACAIEDAGFEIRDSIAWLYGSGFPKSLDVSKAIDKAAGARREVVGSVAARMPQAQATDWGNPGVDNFRDARKGTVDMDITAPATDAAKQWQGWGTALKPAFEPIVVARKPFKGTVAANVMAHGTGALNIDGCRVGMSDADREAARVPMPVQHNDSHGTYHAGHGVGRNGEQFKPATAGRWPTNVVLDESQAAVLDEQTGTLKSGLMKAGTKEKVGTDVYGTYTSDGMAQDTYGDSGGPSRFFPTFKYQAKAPKKERPDVDGVKHATVKPLELMRWLVKLVTQPGGVVLDPFAGSGTTGEACLLEGMKSILIEREEEYLPLIMQRIERNKAPNE